MTTRTKRHADIRRTPEEQAEYEAYHRAATFSWDQLNAILGLIGVYQASLDMQRRLSVNLSDRVGIEKTDARWDEVACLAETVKMHAIVHLGRPLG